jgi:hypothetical protein
MILAFTNTFSLATPARIWPLRRGRLDCGFEKRPCRCQRLSQNLPAPSRPYSTLGSFGKNGRF